MPTATSFWDHPIATIEKALHLRKRIEALNAQVVDIIGGHETGNPKTPKRRGRPPKMETVVFASPFSSFDSGLGGLGSPSIPIAISVPKKSRKRKKNGRKGKRSASTIAKMKATQRARWAAKKGDAAAPAATSPKKKRRTMSPEARAKIAAAQKARWAKSKTT